MRLAPRPTRRRGSTLVESALVIAVFLLVLFGIFEYCRFLMVLHVANNAARDGARFAAVNVNCPSDRIATKKAEIEAYTLARMGGVDRQMQGCQIAVYSCDQSGFASSPPRVVAKSNPAGQTVDPFAAVSGSNQLADWNAAAFTERIAVRVTGTYTPILPSFLWMQSTAPVKIVAVMGSEG